MDRSLWRGIGVALIGACCCLSTRESLQADPPVAELLKLHMAEAAAYKIYRDEKHQDLLELGEKPVLNWTNISGGNGNPQYGHIFLWLKNGRPEVIGTMFSAQAVDPAKRVVIHEFHSLSPQRLFPVTPADSKHQWRPEKGVTLSPAAEAPAVAEAAAARLVQMRNLARSFAGETRNREGKTWQLRLMTTPMIRYEPTGGDVLDGSLFAMVSSEGTDPELILIIEARHPAPNDPSWAWHTAAVRFSDKDLTVMRNGKPLWSSVDDESRKVKINDNYTVIEAKDKTYSCYRARIIDELPDAK